MFKSALKWLNKDWRGIIVAYFILFSATYLTIWGIIEPMGIPDIIRDEGVCNFIAHRLVLHIIITLIIVPHVIIIYLIYKRKNSTVIEGDRTVTEKSKTVTEKPKNVVEEIRLDEKWIISENNPPDPIFKLLQDGRYGNVMQVSSKERYAADYYISPSASSASFVEFIVKFDNTTTHGMYIAAELISENKSIPKEFWINIKKGKLAPRQFNNKEWVYYTTPSIFENNWLSFKIDVHEVIDKTIGNEGWKFDSIKKLRVRGNLTVAVIKIYN